MKRTEEVDLTNSVLGRWQIVKEGDGYTVEVVATEYGASKPDWENGEHN